MNDIIDNNQFCHGETAKSSYFGYTCIGGRPEDQDSLDCSEANGREIYTVCDGMGGHAGGSIASKTAVTTLVDSLNRQAEIVPTNEAIITAVNEANAAVYRKAQEEPRLRGMGTTLTLLVIDSKAAYITHIGDSRIYQLRKGHKKYRTFDHSMVFEQVKRKKMTEEEARVHPRANQLSKAIGVLPDIDFKVKKLSYKAGDRFVLCCDGVWNSQPEPDIINMLTAHTDAETTVQSTRTTVEQIGMANGNQHDNHTMIVVDMKTDSRFKNTIFSKLAALFQRNK